MPTIGKPSIKKHRHLVSLNDLQEKLLAELMQTDALLVTSGSQVSAYFASLLTQIRDCKRNHVPKHTGKLKREMPSDTTEKQIDV